MIELKNLSKHYGETKALDDVTCTIQKGEIIGFVGPNGAGKTTAMKIITTYTAPSSGTAVIDGLDVLDNPYEVRQRIGYLPETVPLYADMLVREYLDFIGEARHLNGKLNERMSWVIDACGLDPVINRKISVLSKGFKQRVCLAQALIHDPEVLILDEPTSGLDPLQIIGIRKLIKELSHEKTIIFSTHILSEVASIADRILVINDGRLVADGTFEQLRGELTEKKSFYLSVKSSKKDFSENIKKVGKIDEIKYVDSDARGVVNAHLFYDPEVTIINDLNKVIRDANWDILELQPEKMSLEDSFILLTQGSLNAVEKSDPRAAEDSDKADDSKGGAE